MDFSETLMSYESPGVFPHKCLRGYAFCANLWAPTPHAQLETPYSITWWSMSGGRRCQTWCHPPCWCLDHKKLERQMSSFNQWRVDMGLQPGRPNALDTKKKKKKKSPGEIPDMCDESDQDLPGSPGPFQSPHRLLRYPDILIYPDIVRNITFLTIILHDRDSWRIGPWERPTL